MTLTRRCLIAGAGASLGASVAAQAQGQTAQRAARRFSIRRGDNDVGRHDISVQRAGDRLDVAIDIEIVVRVLGIAAYRYAMNNRETWRGGLLQSLHCAVNDDGRRKAVKVAREGGGLVVDASGYSGPAPSEVASTTYFTPDFLTRPRWISTDSGELYQMTTTRAGESQVETADGPVSCARWRASNGADFDVELFYDANGEWASVAFDGRGERIVYVPDSLGDRIEALWRQTT